MVAGSTVPAAISEPRQARSRATHRRLLRATVDTLVARGHAGTTTTRVCRRAGVSQGALFKHFPSKAALLAATVEHVFARLVDDYRRAFAGAADSEDPIGAAVELLWDVFERPALSAAFELMVAARCDRELAAALAPVQERHAANLRDLARELFPDVVAADEDAFDDTVDLLLSAMQGAAVGSLSRPDPEGDARRLAFLAKLARELFARAGAPQRQGSSGWT